jgi:formate hydrogenlyase subunit 4
MISAILHLAFAFAAAPAAIGLIGKTKATFAGRTGAPVTQPYSDLWRLLNKEVVRSTTTSLVSAFAPAAVLAAIACALLFVPFASQPAPLGFSGSVLAFSALLGVARYLTLLAALDTGSSFPGMGASREAMFGALAEPAFLLVVGALCRTGGDFSWDAILDVQAFLSHGGSLAQLIGAASVLFLLLLAENSRVPVDDPATHLELTMIHEVMILDAAGPDLAFYLYAAALKLFAFAALIVQLVVPMHDLPRVLAVLFLLVGIGVVAVLVGIVESVMARLRLVRVPQFLVGISVGAAIVAAITFFGR